MGLEIHFKDCPIQLYLKNGTAIGTEGKPVIFVSEEEDWVVFRRENIIDAICKTEVRRISTGDRRAHPRVVPPTQ